MKFRHPTSAEVGDLAIFLFFSRVTTHANTSGSLPIELIVEATIVSHRSALYRIRVREVSFKIFITKLQFNFLLLRFQGYWTSHLLNGDEARGYIIMLDNVKRHYSGVV